MKSRSHQENILLTCRRGFQRNFLCGTEGVLCGTEMFNILMTKNGKKMRDKGEKVKNNSHKTSLRGLQPLKHNSLGALGNLY